MIFTHIVFLLNSNFINLNNQCVKFESFSHIQCNHNFDKDFIDGHIISIMILSVQYAFSSPVHLLPVA